MTQPPPAEDVMARFQNQFGEITPESQRPKGARQQDPTVGGQTKGPSWLRRFIIPSLAVTVLAGGGWGAVQTIDFADVPLPWTTSALSAETPQQITPDLQTAGSGSSAKGSSASADKLRELLANESTSEAGRDAARTAEAKNFAARTVEPVDVVGDRYSNSLAAGHQTELSPLSHEPVHNPFTAVPPVAGTQNLVSHGAHAPEESPRDDPDRSTRAMQGIMMGGVASMSVVPPAKLKPDVLRGQEPENQLQRKAETGRAAPQANFSSDVEARAAFQDSTASGLAATLPSKVRPSLNGLAQSDKQRDPSGEGGPPVPDAPTPTAAIPPPAMAQTPADAAMGRTDSPENPLPAQEAARQSDPYRNARPLPAGDRQYQVVSPDPKSLASVSPELAGSDVTPTPGLASAPGTGRPGERLLEGIQNSQVTIEKLAPAEIQVGKLCTFTIRVRNEGGRTAENVLVHDEVPLGTQLLGTSPRALVAGTNLRWDLGSLSTGEERTVELELMPTEEGELGSVATVAFSTHASAKARCTRPQLSLRLSSSTPKVLVGNRQSVQIEISNPGTGDATGVTLLETVPAGVSHAAGPALELEIGTLQAGQSRQLELVLLAEEAGMINNVVTARADANLQVEESCKFEVIAPQLKVSVDGPNKRYLERSATYQVSIENPGTAPARNVQLVTHLPKGLQFVKANHMGEYNSATHSIHWSLAELPAQERGTVELVTLPVEMGEQTLDIDASAGENLEDRTEAQVLVEGLAALMFEVVDLEDPIEVGGKTTYEIRVVNQGSKRATNVQVQAILPPGIRAVRAEGETKQTILGERVVFEPLKQLAPKADTVYRIHVQGIQEGDQRVRVQITTDDMRQPITKEESTRVYADQ